MPKSRIWLTMMLVGALSMAAIPASGRPPQNFNRVSTFSVYTNNSDVAGETVAEISAVSEDGMTLVYTDGAGEAIGFVDITDPASPQPAGTMDLGGEPTSVTVIGGYALVGVNTSESYNEPSGYLAVVDLATRAVAAELELGGQPDSVKESPDGRYLAVVIENERDEDITVGGVEGGLPQAPAGLLQIVDIDGAPADWSVRSVDLAGLADYAPDDPEPEFVDVNARNQAVITLQENNHIVIVDLRRGRVTRHFSAGTLSLDGVDTVEDDVIDLSGSLDDIPREPDAVTWIGVNRVATANEGDLFGGSRGWTIFDLQGRVVYDAGTSFDELAVAYGHYPESRSENKGSEPESIESARFGTTEYVFVGSERGSFIAVYSVRSGGKRVHFEQVLPAGLGPEGLLAIPSRNLLLASSEEDDPEFGVRSTIMLYELQAGAAEYPGIVSVDGPGGYPVPWSALSGMTGIPGSDDDLLAVWDSYYAESRIFHIDVSSSPAVIDQATTIVGGTGDFDPEGITVAPDDSLWVASEGDGSGSRPNRLLQVDGSGALLDEVQLPDEIAACRVASDNTGTLGSGFEGVAAMPTDDGYLLAVAQQRGWDYTTAECEDLDDDPDGSNPEEPSFTRIWLYDPATGEWTHVAYELEPLATYASWTGLSEITLAPDGSLILIERDNRTGDWAELKTLVRITADDWADGVVQRGEKDVYDLLPDLLADNGWTSDKPEGFAITAGGSAYLVTDNDGVDDWSGETQFLRLGPWSELFGN